RSRRHEVYRRHNCRGRARPGDDQRGDLGRRADWLRDRRVAGPEALMAGSAARQLSLMAAGYGPARSQQRSSPNPPGDAVTVRKLIWIVVFMFTWPAHAELPPCPKTLNPGQERTYPARACLLPACTLIKVPCTSMIGRPDNLAQ